MFREKDGTVITWPRDYDFLATTKSVYGMRDINTGVATIEVKPPIIQATIRQTPATNSMEYAMTTPSGRLAVAGYYGLQGATMEIATSKAIGLAARAVTTSEGFLFGGINIRAPFNIPAQRFGQMSINKADYWGPQIGSSPFLARTVTAIKHEWNPLTQYTTGIIPKGTPMKVGIIGPQPGGFYTGGSLQFITNSKYVVNQSTKVISR